ncbi:MAG: TetR/AcrR family transcriptional regulator; helix-turn-helix transcriptional regulator [Treponema sp.]|jgi:AcrR family transcriptional regulator|nr:TetR/AcrR family transcriptional regulator; helix-turn-helix transcriptional regulator [Treponema sp.]
MGIAERKERERTERKALIMRKAKELILEHGADAVSMEDIAAKAELSKATLYLYFPSKEVLFQEICDESVCLFIEYFHTRRAPGLPALESLKLLWGCYLERYGLSDEIIIIFNMRSYLTPTFSFMIDDATDEPVSNSSHAFCSELTALIAQGICEGIFDPAFKPAMVAYTTLSILAFVVENIAKIPKTKRKSQLILDDMKNVFEIFMRGIVRDGVDRSLLALPSLSEH